MPSTYFSMAIPPKSKPRFRVPNLSFFVKLISRKFKWNCQLISRKFKCIFYPTTNNLNLPSFFHLSHFFNAACRITIGLQNSAITRSQLRPRPYSAGVSASHGQRVAGAIPDLRPSLDTERTTLITGGFFFKFKFLKKDHEIKVTHMIRVIF